MDFAQQKTRSFAASEFFFSPSFFLVVFVLGVVFQFCFGRLGSRRWRPAQIKFVFCVSFVLCACLYIYQGMLSILLRTNIHTHTQSHIYTYTHTHAHHTPQTYTHHTYSHTGEDCARTSLFPSLSLCHTYTHAQTHTHTRTHTLSLSHTHTHTHTPSHTNTHTHTQERTSHEHRRGHRRPQNGFGQIFLKNKSKKSHPHTRIIKEIFRQKSPIVDWFWLLGWLIQKEAMCTRIALVWISTSTGKARSMIWRSQANRQKAYGRTKISISTENQKLKLVY